MEPPRYLSMATTTLLIPLQQSQILAAKLNKVGITSKLMVISGGGHDEELIKAHTTHAIEWFDRCLAKQSEALQGK